jgi:hypothetical protein
LSRTNAENAVHASSSRPKASIAAHATDSANPDSSGNSADIGNASRKKKARRRVSKKGDWVRIVAYHNDYILSWVGPIKNSSEYCILFDFCICGGYDVRMNFIVKLTDMGDERFAYKIPKEEIEIIKKYLAMTVMSKKQMRK